jgi:YVTN family beta-propeller protein
MLAPEIQIRTDLPGYRVERLLGRGGMGVVCLAYDTRLKRKVALKLIAPELAHEPGFRARFLTETELAASLEHPNVVPVYDAGEFEGQLYLVMRFVEGSDLRTLLRAESPLEPARAIAILEQVADALDAAHGSGLLHRDVKPSNVLLDEREHAYLADFGLSRRLGDPERLRGATVSVGTPGYVAPEQIEGAEVDARADQYSLACLLYECVTGRPPFSRDSELATLWAHLSDPPPTAEDFPALDQVIARGLAKNPADRHATCTELAAAAGAALGVATPARPRWSRAPVVIALCGTALAAAAVAAFFVVRSGTTGQRASAATGDGRVVRVDLGSKEIVSTTPFGQDLSDIAVGAGSVWAASLGSGTVARIEPASGRVAETISVAGAGSGPSGIAVSAGRLWIVNGGDDRVRLYRVGAGQFSTVEPSLPARPGCACGGDDIAAVASGPWLWTLSRPHDAVERFTAEQVTAEVTPFGAGSYPTAVGIGEGAVWVATAGAKPALLRIDPLTNRILARLTLPRTAVPSAVAAGEGAVWVADLFSDTVLRIEPRLDSSSPLSHSESLAIVARIRVGSAPADLALGGRSVWVANKLDGTVSRIDPTTNRVADKFAVGASPDHLAVGAGSVWVALDPPLPDGATG